MLSLSIFIRIVIIIAIVISATDVIAFYYIKKKGMKLTWKSLALIIIITIIPIVINLWYHFIFKQG